MKTVGIMLDIGWTEILIVMGIAIVIVGPKELPKVLRTVGKWRGKASAYARDFQRSIEDAADHTELDAVKKEIEEANRELNASKSALESQELVDEEGRSAAPNQTSPGVDGGEKKVDTASKKAGSGHENNANA